MRDDEVIKGAMFVIEWLRKNGWDHAANKVQDAADRLEELTRPKPPQPAPHEWIECCQCGLIRTNNALVCPVCKSGVAKLTKFADKPQPPPPGSVRVRVAVCVSADGGWAAQGHCIFNNRPSVGHEEIIEAGVDEGDALYWLTADLPLPTIPEVAASMEEVNP